MKFLDKIFICALCISFTSVLQASVKEDDPLLEDISSIPKEHHAKLVGLWNCKEKFLEPLGGTLDPSEPTTSTKKALPQPKTVKSIQDIPREELVKLWSAQSKFLEYEHKLIDGKELTLDSFLLFDGYDAIGKAIEGFTGRDFSHIGVCLRTTKTPIEKFVFESTGAPSQIFKGIFPQVQISPYDSVLSYNGRVVERPVILKEGSFPDPVTVGKCVQTYLGLPYERHPLELIKSRSRTNSKGDLSSFFCSELAAQVAQDLHYLPWETGQEDYLSSNNFIPGDFAKRTDEVVRIRLFPGVMLGNETAVYTPRKSGCCSCILL